MASVEASTPVPVQARAEARQSSAGDSSAASVVTIAATTVQNERCRSIALARRIGSLGPRMLRTEDILVDRGVAVELQRSHGLDAGGIDRAGVGQERP